MSDLFLKKIICSPGNKLFPLRVDAFIQGFRRPERKTGWMDKGLAILRPFQQYFNNIRTMKGCVQ